MTRGFSVLYVILAWLFLAGLVTVVVAAGYGLFVEHDSFEPHRNFGWILHLSPILLLIVALGARIGSPRIWWVVALALFVFIQPLLPGIGGWVAAVHPLNATLIMFVAVNVALRAPPGVMSVSVAFAAHSDGVLWFTT